MSSLENFDVESYLDNIRCEEISSWDLLWKLKDLRVSFEYDDIKEFYKNLLNSDRLKNKLRMLLEEECHNIWNDYSEAFEILGVNYFFCLFSFKDIDEYFDGKKLKMYKYDLYKEACCIDINGFINVLINNSEMFVNFCDELNKFYDYFYNVNYDNMVAFIKKCEELNIDISNYIISGIKLEDQLKMLDEDLCLATKVAIIDKMGRKNRNAFLTNDKRALFIYSLLSVNSILESELNPAIINDKEFMRFIQSSNLVEFRRRINQIASNNGDYYIEERMQKFTDSLISSVNILTGIFGEYMEAFTNMQNFQSLEIAFSWEYLQDLNVLGALYSTPKNDDVKIFETLRNITNKKLSELIVDNLFRDNIYDVWLNIEEIIRYSESVSNEFLSIEKLEFYKTILNIDNLSIEEKISLYNEYKDKKVYESFYDDIRNSKNDAYSIIKDSLIDISEHSDYISESLSMENGVTLYDLSDRKYYMLVRYSHDFEEIYNSKRSCYSIICEDKTNSFEYDDDNKYGFLYGYSHIDMDYVIHMSEADSDSLDTNGADISYFPNKIMTPEQITKTCEQYNEINILNILGDDGKFISRKPDFIVCKDKINDNAINESRRLNIPIVLIKSKSLELENYSPWTRLRYSNGTSISELERRRAK